MAGSGHLLPASKHLILRVGRRPPLAEESLTEWTSLTDQLQEDHQQGRLQQGAQQQQQ